MLNKKLVIAALLAVSTNVMPEVSATAKPEAKKEADVKKPEVKKEEVKKVEPKKEEPKKVEPKKLPEDPSFRPSWQKGAGTATQDSLNAKGTYTLCDQGNTAMWKAAEDKYTKLAKAEVDAKAALEGAKKEYDALEKLVTAATEAQSKHTKDNATFLSNAKQTISNHAALLKSGSDQVVKDAAGKTASALAAYKADAGGKVAGARKVTEDAEALVKTQRLRLESLLTLKQNNAAEETAWATRIAALKTASQAADLVVANDDINIAEATAIGMTRSYLFRTLQIFSPSDYNTKCDALKECLYSETKRTASTSEWAWQNAAATCTKQKIDNGKGGTTDENCKIYGLKGAATGLIQSSVAATFLGAAKGVGAATGAYKTLTEADYLVKQGVAATTRLVDATTVYKNWQALSMYAYALNTGCWKTAGTTAKTNAYQASDWFSVCGTTKSDGKANTNGITDALTKSPDVAKMKFNPLINKINAANVKAAVTQGYKYSQEDIFAEATAKRTAFGESKAGDKNLTTFWDGAKAVDLVEIKAKAQIGLWLKTWSNTEIVRVNAANIKVNGDFSAKAAGVSAKTWAATGIGKLETTQANDTLKKTKAKADWDFAVTQSGLQGKDDAALDLDITNAQTLLGDLVKEVAAKARLEQTSKKAWEDAVQAEATAVADNAKLGTPASKDGKTAATGEYAVLIAAEDVKGKIEAQSDFHKARVLWATENLGPAQIKWVAATRALNGTPVLNTSGASKGLAVKINDVPQVTGGAILMAANAKASMAAAKEACKVAAFGIAQKAFVDSENLKASRAKARSAMEIKYTALSKFPTDGSRGTLCHLPKGSPDGDRVKECKEEEGGQALCCGAAQRFLKNGTKLTIETCQLAIAGTYTYYPPLEANDVEQPIPETWRFQCISGAQKLAAVAAAVLAAGALIA